MKKNIMNIMEASIEYVKCNRGKERYESAPSLILYAVVFEMASVRSIFIILV